MRKTVSKSKNGRWDLQMPEMQLKFIPALTLIVVLRPATYNLDGPLSFLIT